MSNSAKNKGNNFELAIINRLKEIGFEAESSRAESRNEDNKGRDIVTNCPYDIQCKAEERTSIPIHELILKMRMNNLERPIVAHKRNGKGVVISMAWETFQEILETLEPSTSK